MSSQQAWKHEIFTLAAVIVYTDLSRTLKSAELLTSSKCRAGPSVREAERPSELRFKLTNVWNSPQSPAIKGSDGSSAITRAASLYKPYGISYSWKPVLMFSGTRIKYYDFHQRWRVVWLHLRLWLCAPLFKKICFGVLWTLMNLLLLHVKLSFTSPEKHCKINQILPKAASIFGQLNSKSVLSQRSRNLPNRRSHSSRTKTHSYAYIKQTGPGLVSACMLRRVVARRALTVRSPWWLSARQRLLPVSLSSVAHKSDPRVWRLHVMKKIGC